MRRHPVGAPGPGDVHLWCVPLDVPEPVVTQLHADLVAEERARAAVLGSPRRRREFVIARAASRRILGSYLGTAPGSVPWLVTGTGKPGLGGSPATWGVSLSHSGDLALLAVTRHRDVGVDLERIRPTTDPVALARRYFTTAEQSLVRRAPSAAVRHHHVLRLWVRKEACVKAAGAVLGEGLALAVLGSTHTWTVVRGRHPGPAGPWAVADVGVCRGYLAAVALSGTARGRLTVLQHDPGAGDPSAAAGEEDRGDAHPIGPSPAA